MTHTHCIETLLKTLNLYTKIVKIVCKQKKDTVCNPFDQHNIIL